MRLREAYPENPLAFKQGVSITIDDQPINATFFSEVKNLTDFITPDALGVTDLHKQLTAGVGTKRDRVLACWRWVAEEVKYVKFVQGRIWINGKSSVQKDLWQMPSMLIMTRVGNCIAKGTKVLVIKKGQYQIKKIEELAEYQDYQVLSYNFQSGKIEPKPITGWFNNGEKEVVSVRYNNGEITRTTPGHRFFHDGTEITIQKALSEQMDIHNVRVMPSLSCGNVNRYKYTPEHLWLVGMYIAEGYSDNSHTVICNDDPQILSKIEESLDALEIPYSRTQFAHSNYVRLLNKPKKIGFRGKKMELAQLGHTAGEKHLTPDFLSLSRPRLIQLMQGYCDGDGYLPSRNGKKRLFASRHMGKYHYKKSFILQYGTASEELADQLKLIHLIMGRPLWYYFYGARANRLPRHLMIEYKNPSYGRMEGFRDLGRLKIKEIISTNKMPVYDLTIADNHNFMLANGVLVHNCSNKSFLLASLLRNELPEGDIFCALGNLYNGKPGGHAWIQVCMEDEWYTMESTMPTAPPLIPITQTKRYEAVHFFNDKEVQAVEGRTQLIPFTTCYSTWLHDYLSWAYINRG